MLGHSRLSPMGIYPTLGEEDLRLARGRAGLEARGELSTVVILGQIITIVGAGEVWSGEGTLASPMGAARFTKYLPLRAVEGCAFIGCALLRALPWIPPTRSVLWLTASDVKANSLATIACFVCWDKAVSLQSTWESTSTSTAMRP